MRFVSLLYLSALLAVASISLPPSMEIFGRMMSDVRSFAFDELQRHGDGTTTKIDRIKAYSSPLVLFGPFMVLVAIAVLSPFLAAPRALNVLWQKEVHFGAASLIGALSCFVGICIQGVFLLISPADWIATLPLIIASVLALALITLAPSRRSCR